MFSHKIALVEMAGLGMIASAFDDIDLGRFEMPVAGKNAPLLGSDNDSVRSSIWGDLNQFDPHLGSKGKPFQRIAMNGRSAVLGLLVCDRRHWDG